MSRHVWPTVAVVLAAVGVHLFVSVGFGYWRLWDFTLNHPSDTAGYRAVGEWLLGESAFADTVWAAAIRPWGYPLLMAVCSRIHAISLVVVQVLFWFASHYFLFRLLRERFARPLCPVILTLLSIFTLTPLVLPFFALSESLALFLQMLALYCLHRFDLRARTIDILLALLFLSLLTVVRPGNVYVLMLAAIGTLLRLQHRPLWLAGGVLMLAPVLAQVGLMHKHFGLWKLSIIDAVTMDQYLLLRADAERFHVPVNAARAQRQDAYKDIRTVTDNASVLAYQQWVNTQVRTYWEQCPRALLAGWAKNNWENMCAASPFVQVKGERPVLYAITGYQNMARSFGGFLLACASILYALHRGVRRELRRLCSENWFELSIAGWILYQLLISGVTFLQADRMTLPLYQPVLVLLSLWILRLRREARAA